MQRLVNIYRLGLKELIALFHDPVLLVLMLYAFTVMVYVPATGTGLELRNASVAVVDEDHSILSRRLTDALLPPYFQAPVLLEVAAVDGAMDRGDYTFVLDIPPRFQADVLAGRQPALQLNVDATAMSQAGIGRGYIEAILAREIQTFVAGRPVEEVGPVKAVVRVLYNPNLYSSWFMGVMMLSNAITLLAIILTGSALIREREHGTLEHLLVMPLTPVEIMLAKVWANGLVILVATAASMLVVVHRLIGLPLQGALGLFLLGTALYLFAVTAIGIFLATVARSMPQLGLLAIPVIFPMMMLSGGYTPQDSMPEPVRWVMQISPSSHFVALVQGVLYRGAGLAVIWPRLLLVGGIGLGFFLLAAWRLRRTLARQG